VEGRKPRKMRTVGFDVFMVAIMKNIFSWDDMP
jgi:hypothetical protein